MRGALVIILLFATVLSTSAGGSSAAARVSTRSGKLAFVRNGDIYVMNADGSGQRDVTRTATAREGFPAWSPDGKRIAFDASESDCSARTAQRCAQIVVTNANGSDKRELSPVHPTDWRVAQPLLYQTDTEPSWSPDGRKIVFVSDRTAVCPPSDPFCGEIYVMDADGRSLRRLTRMKRIGPVFFPTWSPDGTEIAFSDFGAGYIALVKPDGRHLRRLTPKGFEAGGRPAWSPDGQKIAVFGSRPTPTRSG